MPCILYSAMLLGKLQIQNSIVWRPLTCENVCVYFFIRAAYLSKDPHFNMPCIEVLCENNNKKEPSNVADSKKKRVSTEEMKQQRMSKKKKLPTHAGTPVSMNNSRATQLKKGDKQRISKDKKISSIVSSKKCNKKVYPPGNNEWLVRKENTRCYKMSNHLTAAAKLSSNDELRCDKAHKTVVAECVHVLNSRIKYEYKVGGSSTFMRNEILRIGCLYKELTVPPGDNNRNREQYLVMAVMIIERNLEWNNEDAVMIKSLATAKQFEGKGLASSFFNDICVLHESCVHVFTMVLPFETPDVNDLEDSLENPETVSYTHLTLPTICSV